MKPARHAQCIKIRGLAVAAGLLLVPLIAAAQAYKWTDAQGKVHFSDTPPPDGKADQITIRPQTAENPQAKNRDWRAQMQESNMRRDQEQRKNAAEEKNRQFNEYKCKVAQQDFDVLKRERPVYRLGKDGQKEYVDDKDRPAALKTAQERVDNNCRR